MTSDFQKTAKPLRLDLPHPGILGTSDFYEHYDLHCYEPSDELKPFVVHIWTQRKRTVPATVRPLEVQTGPETYLYLNPREGFVQGVSSTHFHYDPTAPGIWAGVKFTPGGLHAFWPHSLATLSNSFIPAETVFPELTAEFRERLDHLDDAEIVAAIEQVLLAHSPRVSRQLQEVARVMEMIYSDSRVPTAADIARRIGKSDRSLQQLFRHHVGTSLKWALMRKRLINAIGQAATSPDTLTDIALEHGYSSQSHFVYEFKSATGIPPSSYRKATR